jgi:hypothetical protein
VVYSIDLKLRCFTPSGASAIFRIAPPRSRRDPRDIIGWGVGSVLVRICPPSPNSNFRIGLFWIIMAARHPDQQ